MQTRHEQLACALIKLAKPSFMILLLVCVQILSSRRPNTAGLAEPDTGMQRAIRSGRGRPAINLRILDRLPVSAKERITAEAHSSGCQILLYQQDQSHSRPRIELCRSHRERMVRMLMMGMRHKGTTNARTTKSQFGTRSCSVYLSSVGLRCTSSREGRRHIVQGQSQGRMHIVRNTIKDYKYVNMCSRILYRLIIEREPPPESIDVGAAKGHKETTASHR